MMDLMKGKVATKNANLDLPVTKRDLQELATKKEFRRVVGRLDKKIGQLDKKIGQLDKKIDGVEKGLRAEMRVVVEQAKEEIREDISQSTSKVLNTLDGFLKEIAASREERVIVGHRVLQHSERIEDHEKRIGVLEQKTAVFAS